MYKIPHISDSLKEFTKRIGCVWIGAVAVTPKPLCRELHCHNNVLHYVDTYGGERKIGYYFIENIKSNKYEAILHSIVSKGDCLLDITPFADNRQYNIIGITEHSQLTDLLPPHIVQP